MKHVKAFREHFKNLPVFTMRDVRLFLGLKKPYAYLLLHNLVKKDEVHRITKGVYTFNEELQLVGLAFQPYYYGLQDALSLHNIWEQETNPVVITPRKVRAGVRQFLGNNYVVKRIDRRLFFGFEPLSYHGVWMNVSDLEKTLIDFVYFRQPLDSAVLKELKKKLDMKTLSSYLKKCPEWTRKRVKKLFSQP